jgi:hypothetical protein
VPVQRILWSEAVVQENKSVSIPEWVWHGIVLLALVACVTSLAALVGSELREARKANQAHATTLANHEVRIVTLELANQRIDAKLDKILERLGGR